MTHTIHRPSTHRKALIVVQVLVFLSVGFAVCLPAKAAAAAPLAHKDLAPTAEGPQLGYVPAHAPEAIHPRSKSSATKKPAPQLPVQWRGGPIQDYTKTYVIFWLPAGYTYDETVGSASYEALIQRYLTDVGSSTFYNTVTQYGDSLAWILPRSTVADVAIDTTPYPVRSGKVFTIDSDIQAEVVKWIRARGWYYGRHEQFLVYTASGVQTWEPHLGWSNDGAKGYCAYHTYVSGTSIGLGDYPIMYANIPDQENHYGCYAQVVTGRGKAARTSLLSPNNDVVADTVISITSHEQFETITDPQLNAWADAQGNEIGDKCAYTYGALAADGGNVTLNGHRYILQGEWSNAPVGTSGAGCAWSTAFPFHGQ